MSKLAANTHNPPESADDARAAVYRTILERRDVRGQYRADPIPDAVLSRVLIAAHHAPSVGFMQPWNFVVITSAETKRRVHRAFEKANAEAAEMFAGEKQAFYRRTKLEGIMESPVNICVTCDRDRAGPQVIGRTHIDTVDLYSTVCAVQNLWLAARAEGLGVGWVSIFHEAELKEALDIPQRIVPIAYLCVGYVTHFSEKPDLETAGWRPRLPLKDLIYFEGWEGRGGDGDGALLARVRADQEAAQNGLFVTDRID